MMQSLRMVSLLAANSLPIYRDVARYLSHATGLDVGMIKGASWTEQERMLDAGRAEIGFLCGLLYTQKTAWLDLLAAPVMRGARYDHQPVYFSDVVVPHDSRFSAFDDLHGARWLYNDPGSFSGYAVLRAHLAALGETGDFCGLIGASGGHLRSLELVAASSADAAAIDSTVLDLELQRRPELAARIRVVATIGPHPIPPVVIAKHVPADVAQQIREALLRMHADELGSTILAGGPIERFVAMNDADYDAIRRTARDAEQVQLSHELEIAIGG